uniref:Myb-like DNA-binding protein n=1 Tax=Solanum tuberosum TaxID=4113 RepID=M1CJI2_SOLTU
MIDWLVIILYLFWSFLSCCVVSSHIWSPDAIEVGPTLVSILIHATTSMITTCIDVCFELQEDDILREQIRIHGIDDNWTIIASNFKDKTTRQCKRRWFTYLNSDFKKGGWSPEEDMLLCAAQKIFGNRWTEIAKVVSGRTDNAVKNRFTTICKKKAKHAAMAEENRVTFSNKLDTDRICDVSAPIKKLRRSHTIESLVDDCPNNNQPLRHPFAVLAQNVNNLKDTYENGTFLKKNDRKINVLMQQEELLNSLTLKVDSKNTNQSLENAWKVVDDFLHQMKEGDMLKFRHTEMNSGHNIHKNLITNSSSNERNQPSKRQLALSQESGGSSEYNTGSTLMSHALSSKTKECQVKTCARDQEIQSGLQKSQIGDQTGVHELENGIFCDLSFPHDTPPVCDEMKDNDVSATAECEYPSPLQVTPQFRSLAEAIPSPKFSESERQFLLKTLGVESTSPHRTTKPPSCKRALLQSL